MGLLESIDDQVEVWRSGLTVNQYLQQLVESRLGYGYMQPYVQYGVDGRPVERTSASFETYARNIYAAHPVIFGLMEARRSVFSEARFCWRAVKNGNPGDVLPISDGLELLNAPWEGAQSGTLISRMRQDADLGGTAFVVREENRLRRLRPDWVQIVLSGDPWTDLKVDFLGIVYAPNGPDNTPAETYLSDEVAVWGPIPDPLAQFRGMSWLTPVIRELQADNAATQHRQSTLSQGAWLGPIVSAPQGTNLEQFKKFVEAADSAHAGPNNAGRMVFLAPGSEVKTVAQSLRDLDMKAISGGAETRIAAASRVPAVIAQISEGLQGSSLNAGNYTAAKRQWIDGSLRPDWRSLCEALSVITPPPDLSGLDLPEGTTAQLWILESDIALLHEDRLEAAQVRSANATTINTLVTAGFVPDSIVQAVRDDDLSALKHSGAYSVQLQAPGTEMGTPGAPAADADGDGQPDPQPQDQQGEDAYQAALEELRASRAALLDAADLLRSQIRPADEDEETQRSYTAALASFRSEDVERADRYSIRTPAGAREPRDGDGDGFYSPLKGAPDRTPVSSDVVSALESWMNGEGDDDPLEGFSEPQLRMAASQLGVQAPQGTSKPRLKLALLEKARDDVRSQRREADAVRESMPSGYRVERLEDGRWSVQQEGGAEFAQADTIEQARELAEADRDRRVAHASGRRREESRLPGGGPTPPARPPVTPMTAEGKEPRKLTDAEKLADDYAAGRISKDQLRAAFTGRGPEHVPPATAEEEDALAAARAFARGLVLAGDAVAIAETGDSERLRRFLQRQNLNDLANMARMFGVHQMPKGSKADVVQALTVLVMAKDGPEGAEVLPSPPKPVRKPAQAVSSPTARLWAQVQRFRSPDARRAYLESMPGSLPDLAKAADVSLPADVRRTLSGSAPPVPGKDASDEAKAAWASYQTARDVAVAAIAEKAVGGDGDAAGGVPGRRGGPVGPAARPDVRPRGGRGAGRVAGEAERVAGEPGPAADRVGGGDDAGGVAPAKAATAKKATATALDLTGARGLSDVPAVREVQIENRVRGAYRDLRTERDAWVDLVPLRQHQLLDGIDRAEVDEAIRRMGRGARPAADLDPGAYTQASARQHGLSLAEYEATGVQFGGRAAHRVFVADPSPRRLPAAPAKKAAPRKAAGSATVAADWLPGSPRPLSQLSAAQAARAAREGLVDTAAAAAHIRAQADEAEAAAERLRRPDVGPPDRPTGRQRSMPATERDRQDAAARREVEAARLRRLADRIVGVPTTPAPPRPTPTPPRKAPAAPAKAAPPVRPAPAKRTPSLPSRPGRVSVSDSRDWTPAQHVAHAEQARRNGDNAEARLHRGLADSKNRALAESGRGVEHLRSLTDRDDARRFLRSLTRAQLDDLAGRLGVGTEGSRDAVIARILAELFGG